LDSANGRDKLIFENNWCFLALYKLDSIPDLRGYQVLVGNLDKTGNILCWEMSYDYFLKHRHINGIPAWKFEFKNLNHDGSIKKLERSITYVEIPEGTNKYLYRKVVKQLAINTDKPYLCGKSFDSNFFRSVAQSRTPDIILTKDRSIIERKINRTEKKYERIAKRNKRRDFLKRIRCDCIV
jgi:hypothetical protein